MQSMHVTIREIYVSPIVPPGGCQDLSECVASAGTDPGSRRMRRVLYPEDGGVFVARTDGSLMRVPPFPSPLDFPHGSLVS